MQYFEIIEDQNNFMNEIYNELDIKNKIVICSQSKRDVENIVKILREKYEDIDIYSYTSLNSDADQLKNVNKYWAQADVLIYSPVIESGINYDNQHFNRLFGLFSNMSSSQRAFLQMINRVRKIQNPKITMDIIS